MNLEISDSLFMYDLKLDEKAGNMKKNNRQSSYIEPNSQQILVNYCFSYPEIESNTALTNHCSTHNMRYQA